MVQNTRHANLFTNKEKKNCFFFFVFFFFVFPYFFCGKMVLINLFI